MLGSMQGMYIMLDFLCAADWKNKPTSLKQGHIWMFWADQSIPENSQTATRWLPWPGQLISCKYCNWTIAKTDYCQTLAWHHVAFFVCPLCSLGHWSGRWHALWGAAKGREGWAVLQYGGGPHWWVQFSSQGKLYDGLVSLGREKKLGILFLLSDIWQRANGIGYVQSWHYAKCAFLQALNLFRKKTGSRQHLKVRLDKTVPLGGFWLSGLSSWHASFWGENLRSLAWVWNCGKGNI